MTTLCNKSDDDICVKLYPVSIDSVFEVSVIGGLSQPEKTGKGKK
jgi:hypothetical protein